MKMGLMQRLKGVKENKKGFTMVELIAVIVILGILMAIMIPNFINYMNMANGAQDKVTARSLYVSATALAGQEGYKPTAVVGAWKGSGSPATDLDGLIKMAGFANTDVLPDCTITVNITIDGIVGLRYETPNSSGTNAIEYGTFDGTAVASSNWVATATGVGGE